jgi:Zn-dependent alcohol dehydrogenase
MKNTRNSHLNYASSIKRVATLRLFYARNASKLALIATALSACITLAGAGLVLSGKIPEGTAAATSGLVTTGLAASVNWLAKDANDRLDKILPELIKEKENSSLPPSSDIVGSPMITSVIIVVIRN